MGAARTLRRDGSLRAARHWLQRCSQHLIVSGPSYCGKTYFARQLSEEPECVAIHFCRDDSPDTTEAATLVRSLAAQLVKRFPNLSLPSLSTTTLLADYSSAMRSFLGLPLSSLPSSSRSLFLVVDNVQPHSYKVVLELVSVLPPWLRLVITTRPVSSSEHFRFVDFHELVLSENADELCRFIELRLPQCSSQEVFEAAHDSWFYVEQLSKAVERGLINPETIPPTQRDLLDELASSLPARLPLYLLLVKASRLPPPFDLLLAASQLTISDNPKVIQNELEAVAQFAFETKQPVTLAGEWSHVEGDLASFHSAWAEMFKTKPRKRLQDLVDVAYHLAHSGSPPSEAVRTLASLGCSDLMLRCSVVDVPTSALLCKAGATIENTSPQDDLVYVCSLGDLAAVQRLLPRSGPNEVATALVASAARGHSKVCSILLERMGIRQASAMSTALRAAACAAHVEVVDLLLQKGTDVNSTGQGGRTALRAAAWAGHATVVSRLLEAGASIDARDTEGRTALMASAFMDHEEVVRLLLSRKASVSATDSARATALHLALANGSRCETHSQTVKLLLEGGSDVHAQDAHGRQCLHLAAFHGDASLSEVLRLTDGVDVADNMGRTALMLAASQGRLEAVDALVAAGADIDAIDSHGRTALQLAAAGGHLTVVDLLLTLGADEAHRDNDGAVALHYAVTHGDVALVRALATSATVRAADRLGQEALIIAAQHNHNEVVQELLALGAQANSQTLDGMTAMRAAATAGNSRVLHALAEHVTDWEQRDLEGCPLLHSLLISGQTAMAELLLSMGASSSTHDAHGRTASHVVSATNDVTAARMLRRVGVTFEEKDEGGRTPLMTGVWSCAVAVVQFLLDAVGVEPNVVDDQGASALSVAAQLGHRELVVLLLRFGADPALRDDLGRTALDVAQISGHEHIRCILQTASGSADSSGFGSMPASPLDAKSLARRAAQR